MPPQTRRRSLPDLPADVWIYIIQLLDPCEDFVKCNAISLASTNRFLRGIALPIIFNTLRVAAHPYNHDLKKAIQRLQGINSVPHILNLIHRLRMSFLLIGPHDPVDDVDHNDGGERYIRTVDLDDGYTTDDHDDDSDYTTDDNDNDSTTDDSDLDPARRQENNQLTDDTYREMVTLVSSLPRLYHLEFYNCAFVPEFLSHIFRISSLQSLRIDTCPINNPIELQAIAPSLHVFQYVPESRFARCEHYVKLLASLAGQLTVFSFPFNVLADILADSNMPTSLPKLRKLSLFNLYIEHIDNYSDLGYLHSFLSLTPNLHELRIIGEILSKTRLVLPDTVVPHLRTLIASSYIANGIAPKRPLEKLHILAFKSRSFREDYIVVSQNIKHVVYGSVLDDLKEELSHLARVFPNATRVEIVAIPGCKRTSKRLSNAVLSILPKFCHLKRCIVSAVEKSPSDHDRPSSHCPVGHVGDPKYRSHPTLEDLQILSSHRWTWTPGNGWHSVHSSYEADAFHLLHFFN